MLHRCLICNKYFDNNLIQFETHISEYFLFDEFKNDLNFKFLEMIIKERTNFCHSCINLGLYIHENDEGDLLTRIKILIRKYYHLSSTTTSTTTTSRRYTSTSTRDSTSNCSRNTRTPY